MKRSNRPIIIVAAACAVLGLALGVIIGYFGRDTSPAAPEEDPKASQMIMEEIGASNIENNLKILTENPHIAGREVDEEVLVKFVKDSWEEAGLEVEIHPYDVLLSYPDQEDSNYVGILKSDNTLVDKSRSTEDILDPSQNKSGVVNPFNAYAASGDVEGEIVYLNYGRIEDFINATRVHGLDLTNKICMARYGKIFRGDKALHAEQYNCSGLILYSDPADYTLEGEGVYPDDWYLPETGAQRGTLMKGEGDPLTIHYPSFDTAWRLEESLAPLPHIPVTPIGYGDAVKYLSQMAGDPVPPGWSGGLDITYKLGPGFMGDHENSTMKMHVTTKNERKTIHNVIGYIRGTVEPDRYVLIGNHRDAWVFGAMDPSSGTAAMLEVSRAFGQAVKDGWKPRRTIVFCSWGGEEYGLIGSAEWVEEFQKALSFRSVAYLNADTIVSGSHTLYVSGMPSLRQLSYDSAKLVKNPDPAERDAGRATVYDTWKYRSGGEEARYGSLGSGSDYTMFLQLTGITAMDVRYIDDRTLGLASYPVYHSVYETFDLVKTFVDPNFHFHQAAARVLAEIARKLADSPLLPFSAVDYASKMTQDKDVMLGAFGNMMKDRDINTDLLDEAMQNFTQAAAEFQKRAQEVDMKDPLALRAVNDQMMQLERSFIDKEGIEGRDQFSHVIYAPSKHNTYGGAAFPGLVDSMFDIGDDVAAWDEVERQFSILLYHIGSAASTLRDVSPMKGYSNK